MKFRTKKEKLAHHHEKEPQCAEDSKTLLLLLSKLKNNLGTILGQMGDDQIEVFKNDLEGLNDQFQTRLNDTLDKETFVDIVGSSYL